MTTEAQPRLADSGPDAPGLFLLLLCFFLSGFAALLYETAWAREFATVFGTSELAVVSVLAAYMAGLAAGAAAAGRLVARVRRPVWVYGLLELGIAASALAVPLGLRAATWLQAALFGGRATPPDEASVAGALFYVAFAFAILLLPTGLMGATLPLLARHAVRSEAQIGSRVGALYAVNTAGAVAGALGTGFVILPALGLRQTVLVGAATNVLVFAAAALLARRAPLATPATGPPARARFHWVLPLVAFSGMVSFSYEVLWTRLLGQLLGGNVQGFATMLASFLLGIALGSALASPLARDPRRAVQGFVAAQLGAALLSLAAFRAVDWLPGLARSLGAGLAGSPAANVAIACLGLLPGALCIGAAFPFAVRLVARSEAEAAPAAARVYAWNTVGAIVGALASGFLLLPALRFAGSMALAVALNLLLALAAAGLARPRQVWGMALALLAGLALWWAPPPTPWDALRARGGRAEGWQGEVVFYQVGRSSTVMLFEQEGGWRLTTNGMAESQVDRPGGPWPDRYPTARWLGMLPVLLRPEAGSVGIVGLGGGHTLEAVPSSVGRVFVFELEPEVVGVHRVLASLRGESALDDPRVELVTNDARAALLLSDARLDAVVSQPSNPWTAGASHLYTREFFSLVARRLKPDGVFVQWIGLEFVDRDLLGGLLSALLEAFAHVSLFQPQPGTVLFAASKQPLGLLESAPRALEATPADFERFGLVTREDVAAHWVLDTAGAERFASGIAPNSDDRNRLAMRAARLGQRSLGRTALLDLEPSDDPLRDRIAGLDAPMLIRKLLAAGQRARARELAAALPEPTQRETALGWALGEQAPQRAAQHLREALRLDPDAAPARFGLLRLGHRFPGLVDESAPGLEAGLGDGAAAVLRGWGHADRGEWSELRALEPELASAGPRDPHYSDAWGLRVLWRAHSDDAGLRQQAVELASAMLRTHSARDAALPAAVAFATAGRSEDALLSLAFLGRFRLDPRAVREALAVLEQLPTEVGGEGRVALRRRLLRQR